MANYAELIDKINNILQRNGIKSLNNDLGEINPIIEDALTSIYTIIGSRKKRDLLSQGIIKLAEAYYAKIVPFAKEVIARLNTEMPGDDEYYDIYQKILDDYAVFINDYLKNNDPAVDNLKSISERSILLIRKFKNNIIRYISVHNADYPVMVIHGVNSTLIALIGALEMKYDDEKLLRLGISCLLHDIGMFMIPDAILNKSGKLTDDEFTTIKTHTAIAYKLLNKKNLSKEIADGIVQHHEQFDGNGYPRKLKGQEIGEFARIIAIADSFEAQMSKRVYREAKTGYNAMKEVISSANNKFDPLVLRAFLVSLSIYPPGTLVQLNDYSIGIVDSINNDAPLRPVLRMVIDKNGNKCQQKVFIDLKIFPSLFIAQVLNKEDYARKSG